MTEVHQAYSPETERPLLIGIGVVAVIWAILLATGLIPGHGPESDHGGSTEHGEHHADEAGGEHAEDHGAEGEHADEHAAEGADAHDNPIEGPTTHEDAHDDHGPMPDYYAVIPFVVLLLAIAILPLLAATEHWWENNLNRLYVAVGLAALTLIYYMFLYADAGIGSVATVLDHAILGEYIPFIVLLFSLYTIAGGIRITGDLPAHPLTNTIFIAIGGALASFIGTTGAAMLFIRPLLETNQERKYTQHTVVFFIFVVCNTGGCLLPIGDPPLFLGYLKGVPFLWTFEALWLDFLIVNAALLAIYYALDRFYFYPHETVRDIVLDETKVRPLSVTGQWLNTPLLLGVILSVAFLDPTKAILNWHPWPYLREIVQLGLVAISVAFGDRQSRIDNRFNYDAIIEVAALFIGIFIAMQPALGILNAQGAKLGLEGGFAYFWATGTLSSCLDNAPTYVVFYETAAAGVEGPFHKVIYENDTAWFDLVGISLGAVFMGAMTYIGNGPNFMVRAIAEKGGVKMPSFFGYVIQYSLPVLVPLFLIITLIRLWPFEWTPF